MGKAEGNKMIAEFMGVTYHSKLQNTTFINDLLYDSDWRWLMEVIEKIGEKEHTYLNVDEKYYYYPRTFGMRDEEGLYMFRFNCSTLFSAKTLIEAAWLAVVDFIQWQNELTPTNGR